MQERWFGAAAALTSGVLLMLSCDLGPYGPLVLIAPVLLLLHALKAERAGLVAVAAFVAGLLGRASLIAAYLTVFPPLVLVFWAILLPLWFTGIVLATRWLARGAPAWIALLSYPLLATGSEFLFGTISPHGSFGALGYALAGFLPVLQVASIGGVAALTFTATFVPMAIVLMVRGNGQRRDIAILAGIPCVALLIWGFVQLSEGYDGQARVALIAIDALQDDDLSSEDQAAKNAATYAALALELSAQRPDYILLPEKSLIRKSDWRDLGVPLQDAADRSGIPIVGGWDETRADGSHENVAVLYTAGRAPQRYLKRRLIPGLEAEFIPGRDDLVTGDLGIAICKDLDFAPMIRGYGRAGVRLMLVPAWDFRSDSALHARMALVRGVENGFAVARAAADGVLTVSDAFGRVAAEAPTRPDRPVTLVAEVGLRKGPTIYNRIGDLLGWLTVGALLLLTARRLRQRRKVALSRA